MESETPTLTELLRGCLEARRVILSMMVESGDGAAACGDIFTLKNNPYLKWKDPRRAMDLAAENGHWNVVEWLRENKKECCGYWVMDWAAADGHLNVVMWLRENRSEFE